MQGMLILNILAIKSSYKRGFEEPIDGPEDVPDTLQWWIAETGSWRIRTYALDHDIHVYSIEGGLKCLELARKNDREHYGEITDARHEIRLGDCTNQTLTAGEFRKINLEPRLEVSSGRFAFWNPDDAVYRTQSEPR